MIPKQLREFYKKNKFYLAIGILVIAFISVAYNIFIYCFPPKPERHADTFKCVSCGATAELFIPDIHNTSERCKKCGNPYGFIYKCGDCSYEFGVVPPNIKPWTVNKYQMMDAWKSAASCPMCKSENTVRETGSDIKNKKKSE